jgi:periplasmic protein TonB
MYYATKRKNNSTRIAGLVAVVGVNALVFWIAASGFGAGVIRELTETQVAIIEDIKPEEEPPPPPPPVDVELPPPPPQVILPDFVFDRPVAETAIQQVQTVREPARPAEVRPPPPPAPTIATRPSPSRNFGQNMIEAYPAASIRAEEEGTTKVSVCVDTGGKISNVKVIKGSGFDRLDAATLKELPRQRMNPAKGTDGKPMAICDHVMEIVWELKLVKG